MGDVVAPIVGGVLGRKAGNRASSGIRDATQAGVSSLQPTQEVGRDATNFIASLLGLGAPGQAQAAFRDFQDSTGFQERLKRGSQAVTGSRAAGGLLASGSTLRALQDRGQAIAGESLNNFLAQLMGLSNQGVGASSQIANLRATGGSNAAITRQGGANAFAQGVGTGLGAIDLSKLFGG